MAKLTIDAEFSKLLPSDHFSELEKQVLADQRILNPVIVWRFRNIVLDGHQRVRISRKHNIKLPKPIILDFESRQEAYNWVIDHQASRRNLTEEQKRYLIGKRYQVARQPVGKPNSEKASELKAVQLAANEGVTPRTLQNAADFAEAVDSVPTDVKTAVLTGKVSGGTKDLEALAGLPKALQRRAVKQIASGEVKRIKQALPGKQQTKEKPPVSVRAIDKQIEAVYGQLLRLFDARSRACGTDRDNYWKAVDESMGAVLADWKVWRKATRNLNEEADD